MGVCQNRLLSMLVGWTLPEISAILMFTRATRFWPQAIYNEFLQFSHTHDVHQLRRAPGESISSGTTLGVARLHRQLGKHHSPVVKGRFFNGLMLVQWWEMVINSDKWWFNMVVQYGGSIWWFNMVVQYGGSSVIDGASYYGLSSGLEGAKKLGIFIFPYTSIDSRFNWVVNGWLTGKNRDSWYWMVRWAEYVSWGASYVGATDWVPSNMEKQTRDDI